MKTYEDVKNLAAEFGCEVRTWMETMNGTPLSVRVSFAKHDIFEFDLSSNVYMLCGEIIPNLALSNRYGTGFDDFLLFYIPQKIKHQKESEAREKMRRIDLDFD